MIQRYSSRRTRLDESFLSKRLEGAKTYDRIAGYFSSSILEIAGEKLEAVEGKVRIICNSQIDKEDVKTAQLAHASMRREWCASEPENYGPKSQHRFSRLYEFLKSGKLEVKVLPEEEFGLIHGKAGVITLTDGKKTSFLGSVNETYNAWKLNYELLWEDDSPEAIQWVQEEFDALWEKAQYHLSDFIVEDIGRISKRKVIPTVLDWRSDPNPDPAAAVIELPVYRKDFGLWPHQKCFINLAFNEHRTSHGARLILADMVGLGKTLQLAMAAQLMALVGTKPILILAPKTLIWQWQFEMIDRIDLPSAVWDGRRWIDEQGIEYPIMGSEGIKKCPRRIGIVSYGLITSQSKALDYLKELSYECIIVDEAHHARRKNLGENKEGEKADPNNLLKFLLEIGNRTKSFLLATATPVQIHPIEALDLLSVLASGSKDNVLGDIMSPWKKAANALDVVLRNGELPENLRDKWLWIRNPMPFSYEGRNFEILRSSLKIDDEVSVVSNSYWDKMRESERVRIERISHDFVQKYNPFIRHIVRRTRDFLENEKNPETKEPYLKPIKIKLFGEKEAIQFPTYLREAYRVAEEFCRVYSERNKRSGFLKTLLLRRIGSSLYAGQKTVKHMLGEAEENTDYNYYEEEEFIDDSIFSDLIENEKSLLNEFLEILAINQDDDPKYREVMIKLTQEGWIERGCIVFSQYYDSIQWLAEKISSELPDEVIGIYAGNQKSGIIQNRFFIKKDRNEVKNMVYRREIRLLLGTDAASEGLNLQTLGCLINLDLPWNPTRLEQRKGRIQRIGQIYDEVWIYNMRYKESVEDRVHELLSSRLENINSMFGQIPDCIEDVWINVALNEIEDAKRTIDAVPEKHPFEMKYDKIEPVNWEECEKVLDSRDRKRYLMNGW